MNDRSIVPLTVPTLVTEATFTFITHQGFHTQILAYTLDSLVRVSRRVNENHFVSIPNPQRAVLPCAPQYEGVCTQIRHISVPGPYYSDKQSHTLRADCVYLTLVPRYHPLSLPQL